MSAQLGGVIKLLLILILGGALANGFAASQSLPPLLIDNASAPAPLDATH
ncbi:MAG: hypothetical protein ACTHJK_01720 [Sphingomicrobium sp.]